MALGADAWPPQGDPKSPVLLPLHFRLRCWVLCPVVDLSGRSPPRTGQWGLPWYHISQESPVPLIPGPMPLSPALDRTGHWSFQDPGSAGQGPGLPVSLLLWVCSAFLVPEKL